MAAVLLMSNHSTETSSLLDDVNNRCSLDGYSAAATTTLDLRACGLSVLSRDVAKFKSLRKLDLGGNQLSGGV